MSQFQICSFEFTHQPDGYEAGAPGEKRIVIPAEEYLVGVARFVRTADGEMRCVAIETVDGEALVLRSFDDTPERCARYQQPRFNVLGDSESTEDSAALGRY